MGGGAANGWGLWAEGARSGAGSTAQCEEAKGREDRALGVYVKRGRFATGGRVGGLRSWARPGMRGWLGRAVLFYGGNRAGWGGGVEGVQDEKRWGGREQQSAQWRGGRKGP